MASLDEIEHHGKVCNLAKGQLLDEMTREIAERHAEGWLWIALPFNNEGLPEWQIAWHRGRE